MEYYSISESETGLHIEGFPDAVKVVCLNEPEAKRLADLFLHKTDLEFAGLCLAKLNDIPGEPPTVRQALWRSAVVHFIKCFGSSRRFQLAPGKVYKNEPPEAMLVFDYFKNLRNKHVVHDENSYAQSIPGAIVNDGGKSYKIEKIVCFVALAETLNQENYASLELLIQKAKDWVVSEFELVCDRLTTTLEKEQYDELLARESITYRFPKVDEIDSDRNKP